MGADGFETVISCFHMAIYSNIPSEAQNNLLGADNKQERRLLVNVNMSLEMNLDRAIEGVLSGVEPFIS